jgi:hypothetical protein
MYKAIQVPFKKVKFRLPSASGNAHMMAGQTLDLKDLPQLLKPNQALAIINYNPTSEDKLQVRKGLRKLFSVADGHPITLVAQYTDNLWIFCYNKTTAVYDVAADHVTNIKTDWPTNDPFSGVRYGDYFFVCNGSDVIYRISQVITYGTMTHAFTVGQVVTGTTSLATGIILEDTGSRLTLGTISGTFQLGEIITDPAGGSATSASVVTLAVTTVAGSPKATVLKAISGRLFAGVGYSVAYSANDTGTNPPFSNWTVGTNAGDPGLNSYRNAGNVTAIDSLGANIIVFGKEGKWSFSITTISEASSILKEDDFVLQRTDQGGARATIVTDKGLFYVNSGGIWNFQSVGQSNIPFSKQEVKTTLILGAKYFDNIDLSNADLAYDATINTLYLTCARNSVENNLILAYNIPSGTYAEFSGWNLCRFMNIDNILYGTSSLSTTVYQLFESYSDDGKDIWTTYYQEIALGGLEERSELAGGYVDAFLSPSGPLNVSFDIYDAKGNFRPDKLSFTMQLAASTSTMGGYGVSSWGTSGYGGFEDSEMGPMVEWFDGYGPGYIRNFQRLRIKITQHSKVPHQLVWIKVQAIPKTEIRRRKLVKTT